MVTWGRVVVLGIVFASGWGGAMLVPQRPARAAEAPDTPAVATDRDPTAMEANGNLVAQLHDYKTRLALAETRREDAEKMVREMRAAAETKHLPTSEEWGRMAREGTLRVKLPCMTWEDDGYVSIRATRGTLSSQNGGGKNERTVRAAMAGLTSEEREAIPDVYRRAHARIWSAMRLACEGNADFRRAIAELEAPTDASRIATCEGKVLNARDPNGRAAMARVAELRAARGSVDRAASEVERVTFALADAQAAVDDEMVRAFGREKATRIADNNVACFSETSYQLREPGADG